jgi:protein O-GlcNAc transferase
LGKTFPGRVAASLLKSLDLNELIANNFEEYESIAVELANNQDKYLSIKKKLMFGIDSCPLFNPNEYVLKFEESLLKIHGQFVKGLDPDHVLDFEKNSCF